MRQIGVLTGPGTVAAVSTTFNAIDPRTGAPGAAFDEATPADVHEAVTAADGAFRSGALRDPGARVTLLRGAASRLRAAGDEIVAVAGAETGLPEGRLPLTERLTVQLRPDPDAPSIARNLVGNYITSLDMAGFMVTLTKLDDDLTRLWDAPVHTPALRWGV